MHKINFQFSLFFLLFINLIEGNIFSYFKAAVYFKENTKYVPSPIVATNYGPVQGFTVLDDSNSSIDVFLGIPFAQPPIGALRFEEPVALNKTGWPGLLNATEFRDNCVPHAPPDWFLMSLQQGSSTYDEDCLYLNVFTPHNALLPTGCKCWGNKCRLTKTKKALLPVMVLIHGGGFEIGSAREYQNYKDIGAKFVSHGIVVVTIQYRIGILGFASTGDSILPGNLGLWDQQAAIQFIRDNIANFGGDPENVTLMGQSAGAASVSALTLSTHTRDMFQRAIQMSGSAFLPWVYGSRVANETHSLAAQLGCPTTSSASIKSCLKDMTIEQMFEAVIAIGEAREEPNCIKFTARFDGIFFSKDMQILAAEAPKKPTLVGFTDLEALMFTIWTGLNSTISHQAIPWSELDSYGADQFRNYLRMHVAYESRFGANAAAAQQAIFDAYTNGSTGNENSTYYLHKYTELISDLLFVQAIINETKTKLQNDWPLYFYVHAHVNDAAFAPPVTIHESFHANDHGYIFKGLHFHTYDEADKQMSAFMVESFRNFVLKGNPSTSESYDIQWPQLADAENLAHVRMTIPPVVLDQLGDSLLHRIHFWEKEMPAQFPQYDLVREIPQSN